MDESTQFLHRESGLLREVQPVLLENVLDNTAEVIVWIGLLSDDPWTYACSACKKHCHEVWIEYM